MAEEQATEHAEAVAALVAERYGQLVGYARKRLQAFNVPPAWVDAEDVVQNSLERVLARSKPVGKMRPYVFKAVKNEAWHAAQRYRNGLGYGSLDADVQLETAGAAADPCGTADLRLDLEAALSALPPQQRTAVLCTKALGLTQAETALAMGKSPGTVATHVSRAVVVLRSALCAVYLLLVGGAVYLACLLRVGRRFVDPAAGGLYRAFDALFRGLLSQQTGLWVRGAFAVGLVCLCVGILIYRAYRRRVQRRNPPPRGPAFRGRRPDADKSPSPLDYVDPGNEHGMR
ncbi:RNA polymerase sigma factor [Streptomyces sp. NPDC101165]|uniref:RNA polymerase sigma factor n=1 Tax=Streptomyces sp. NPDC101165 TaxID=3366119 RepID=UPI00381713C2